MPQHRGAVYVETLVAENQSVQVGYNFTNQTVHGFATISASLSPLGARTDIAPVSPNRTELELRVFVDGHMVETFFSGDTVITTVTGNVVSSEHITSRFVNTGAFDCSIKSWVLGLNNSV